MSTQHRPESIVNDTYGPSRGDVTVGDEVMIQRAFEDVVQGQVVAQSDDGRVTVSIYGGVDLEVEAHQVWRNGNGYEIERLEEYA